MKRLSKSLEWLHDAWVLVRPYWRGEQCRKGYFWLIVILFNSIFEVYMSVRLNKWNGTFFNTIQNYDKHGFMQALIEGSFIMSLYVFTMIIGFYFRSTLEIGWRKWLTTHYLQQWFESKAYYRGRFLPEQQDNPDQRISEDIHEFVRLVLNLSINFFSSCLTLGSFIVILWNFSGNYKFMFFQHQFHIPGYMVWMALLYALIGTYITFKIGNPLIKINYQKQRYEADFRYNLIRVREYAEQVASYNGEEIEQRVVTKDFDNIVDNFMQSVKRNLKINLFNYGYGQLSTIIPTLISAGRYFSRQITLGDMMQINSAFARVEFSIAYFIYVYSDIANLRSIMDRLHGFTQMVAAANEFVPVHRTEEHVHYMEIRNLNIKTPAGRILLDNFSLTGDTGERILIQGKSGVGKSTLIKAVNGLWPHVSGKVLYQDGLSRLYINQKPYLPKVNLKEAICYPLAHNLPSDEEVKHLLKKCGLENLSAHLYELQDWSAYLSLGEQQKIAFCRVIINKPDILFLDEVTSALDDAAEKMLYQMIINLLPLSLIISIGHRTTLYELHSRVIQL